jgi:AcrR family transcriptional regulator
VPSAKDAYRKAMRDELLAAAQTVVARRGLGGLTIREVLAEAGVAPGTLYAYFEGKDDLVAAMAREIVGRVLDPTAVGDEGDEDAPAGAVLWAMLDAAFSQPLEGAALLADFRGRGAGPEHAATVRGINQQLVSGMRPLVERGRASGALQVDDVDALVELLDIVWDGLTQRQGAGTFVTGYERVGRVMLDLVRGTAP